MISAILLALAQTGMSTSQGDIPDWDDEAWVQLSEDDKMRFAWLSEWRGEHDGDSKSVYPTVAVRGLTKQAPETANAATALSMKIWGLHAIDCETRSTANLLVRMQISNNGYAVEEWVEAPEFSPLYEFDGDEGLMAGGMPIIVNEVCGSTEG
jgi:hypothetical protein